MRAFKNIFYVFFLIAIISAWLLFLSKKDSYIEMFSMSMLTASVSSMFTVIPMYFYERSKVLEKVFKIMIFQYEILLRYRSYISSAINKKYEFEYTVCMFIASNHDVLSEMVSNMNIRSDDFFSTEKYNIFKEIMGIEAYSYSLIDEVRFITNDLNKIKIKCLKNNKEYSINVSWDEAEKYEECFGEFIDKCNLLICAIDNAVFNIDKNIKAMQESYSYKSNWNNLKYFLDKKYPRE